MLIHSVIIAIYLAMGIYKNNISLFMFDFSTSNIL